jgi:hypothetical protein
MRVNVLWFISESMFQDELETMPLCPNLSICERNLAFLKLGEFQEYS